MKDNYREDRARWAREHAEMFMNALEKVGAKEGIHITPMQYVRAYKLCIEDYRFEYPAEYKITELISSEETYEETLVIMTSLMKWFRLDYQKSRKKPANRTKHKKGLPS